jgi:hypothetical protein
VIEIAQVGLVFPITRVFHTRGQCLMLFSHWTAAIILVFVDAAHEVVWHPDVQGPTGLLATKQTSCCFMRRFQESEWPDKPGHDEEDKARRAG